MLHIIGLVTRERGDRRWDLLIRSTGAAALLGIPAILLYSRLVPLVWLAVLAIPANSPLSPVLPASYEPLIMEAAKYERAIWVSLVALGVYIYTEYLNWHVYSWVLTWKVLKGLKDRRWVRAGIRYFSRSPMTTVAFFAATPLPFWVVRSLAILHEYPVRKFLLGTALGRWPRYYAYAWLGAALRIPTVVLVGIIIGGAAAVIIHRLAHGRRLLADTVLDGAVTADGGIDTG